jgi:predicted TIM-barrel fold metal-dependent hydrolase
VRFHERRQEDYWYIGDHKLYGVGAFAQAQWHEFPPSHPRTLSEAFLPAVDATARLAYNDEVGVHYQVLYPNILGFHSHVFLKNMDPALATECVRAYNDWLVEWASADPKRLIPMMMLPFWDVDEAVVEMKRAYELGHKGVLFAARYDKVGLPRLVDDHWEPLLAQAQEMGLSLNFHVGFLNAPEDLKGAVDQSKKMDFTRESSLVLLGNAQNIAEVILSGVCERYPDLKFVSVENGAGWLPFLAESMDWQWLNVGAHKDYPDRLLPSEYLYRQVYGMFWFERDAVRAVIDKLADNLMFETDFPHATSLSPGPASESPSPRDVVEHTLGDLPDEIVGKVLQHTATELYQLEPPVGR